MDKNILKTKKRNRRRLKIRSILSGTIDRPRVSVFRSNRAMFIQVIDDMAGKTLVSGRTSEIKLDSKTEKNRKETESFELGKLIAQRAQEKKIKKVVFDRSGYKYHGRVKAFTDGAREGGLEF